MDKMNGKYTFVKVSEFNYPRILSSQAIVNSSLYIFGGYEYKISNNTYVNSLMLLNITDEGDIILSNLDDNYQYPPLRQAHSMRAIGEYFYIFGGSNNGKYFNDVWQFNPALNTWNNLTTTGDIPSARDKYACDSNGDALVIWGGEDAISIKNDLYILNILKNEWTQIIPDSTTSPSPRTGACIVFKMPLIYIFGGMTSNVNSNELWTYDFGLNAYQLLSMYSEPVVFPTCEIYENVFFFYCGGADIYYPENSNLYGFNLNNFTWMFYSVFSFCGVGGVGLYLDNSLVSIGGRQSLNGINQIFAVSQFNTAFSLDIFYYSPYMCASVYFQDKLYFHYGGLYWNEFSNVMIDVDKCSSFFGYLDLSQIFIEYNITLQCSEGTYFNGTSCNLCPKGSYSVGMGNLECKLCPPGKYNDNYGSNSIRQCYPCPEGKYSNIYGAKYCIDCQASEYCPIGSVNEIGPINKLSASSIQPLNYNQNSYNYDLKLTSQWVLIGFLILIIFMILIPYSRKKLEKIDLFVGNHNYADNTILLFTKTKIGGFFSIILGSIILEITATLIIVYFFQNVSEVKSQVPFPVLENYVTKFTADISITVTYIFYSDSCGKNSACNDNIIVAATGFSLQNESSSCNLVNTSCIIEYHCQGCTIDSTATVKFMLKETLSFSTGIYVNVASTSSIPESESSIFTPIYADTNQIYIGSVPSEFSFIMTPSLFESNLHQYPSMSTGYHTTLQNTPTKGSQYSINDLPTVSNLNTVVYLVRSASGMYTNRYENQPLVMLIYAFLGTIAGILQIIKIILSLIESNYLKFENRQADNRKKFNIARNHSQLKGFLKND